MAEQGKRSLEEVDETEEASQLKKAKLDSEPAASAGPLPSDGFAVSAETGMISSGAGAGGPKRSFVELPASIQQMFNDCFQKLSLTSDDLDTSVYDSLCDFSEDIQNEIVSSFCRADLESIRNKTGYFIGILKQYRKKGKGLPTQGGGGMQQAQYGGYQQQPQYGMQPQYGQQPQYGMQPQYGQQPQYGAPQAFSPPPKPPGGHGLASLPQSVQAKFQNVFAQGIVAEAELDKSIYDSLMDFDEASMGSIVDRYATANLTTVRNKTGYFISILKMARQQRASGQSVSGAGASGGGGGASAYPPAGPPPGAPPAGAYDPYTAYYAAAAAAQSGQMPPGYDPYTAYYAAAAAAQGGYGAPAPVAAAAPKGGLPQSFYKTSVGAQSKLASLYNSFMLQQDDLEDCVFDSLADFPENEQIDMCESFSNANLVGVRNKTAFFIGILKRHRGSTRG